MMSPIAESTVCISATHSISPGAISERLCVEHLNSGPRSAERSGGTRQLSGLVVRMPACCAEGGGSNPGWGAQDFQYRLSSAETQQPVDRMRRKARGCLVLSDLC